MSDITINPANGKLSVNIQVTTPQVVGYQTTVYAADGSTELEHYLSDSQSNNPYTVTLPNPPTSYQGCYISTTFSIIDPAGAGNNYNIDYSIQQQGASLNPVQHISGTSGAGKLNRIAIFHIN